MKVAAKRKYYRTPKKSKGPSLRDEPASSAAESAFISSPPPSFSAEASIASSTVAVSAETTVARALSFETMFTHGTTIAEVLAKASADLAQAQVQSTAIFTESFTGPTTFREGMTPDLNVSDYDFDFGSWFPSQVTQTTEPASIIPITTTPLSTPQTIPQTIPTSTVPSPPPTSTQPHPSTSTTAPSSPHLTTKTFPFTSGPQTTSPFTCPPSPPQAPPPVYTRPAPYRTQTSQGSGSEEFHIEILSKEDNKKLNEIYKDMKRCVEEYEKYVNENREEIKTCRDLIGNHYERLERHRSILLSMTFAADKWSKHYPELNEVVNNQGEQVKLHMKAIPELEEAHSALDSKIIELERMVESLQKRINDMENRETHLATRVNTLEKEKRALEFKVQELGRENNKHSETLQLHSAYIASLQTAFDAFTAKEKGKEPMFTPRREDDDPSNPDGQTGPTQMGTGSSSGAGAGPSETNPPPPPPLNPDVAPTDPAP